MKKSLAFLLALVLCLSLALTSALAAPGLANFVTVNTYDPARFSDVPVKEWYASSVNKAYSLGLVKGVSDTAFNPTGNISIAESITLAARLRSTYVNDSADFTQGDPWYQVYVDYAIENGIIYNGQFNNYDAPATRAQFATIFASAFPYGALRAINHVTALPDVGEAAEYADAVFTLYNAGILTGNDEYGTFNPNSNIQRCEVAAIVTRMADQNERKSFDLRPAQRTVYVATPDELLNAIACDTKIVLTEKYYNLSFASAVDNPYVQVNVGWNETFGDSYYIHDVNNLTIEGDAEIVINNIDANVLHFQVCEDIMLSGLTVGHTNYYDEYSCEGAVTYFSGCYNVTLKNCSFYGCGAVGIDAAYSGDIFVKDCKIYECSYTGIWLSSCYGVEVHTTEFFKCNHYSGFLRIDNSDIALYDCSIHDIIAGIDSGFIDTWDFGDVPSFVEFYNCDFANNVFDYITNDDGYKTIIFTGCTFENNIGAFEHPSVYYYD